MNRYESASHVFYRCQYHLVWTPKFGYKILKGNLGKEHHHIVHKREYTGAAYDNSFRLHTCKANRIKGTL